MARSKTKSRFLPAYVTKFRDRHGTLRYRYRRKGHVGGYFHHPLGTEEFRAEYAAFEAATLDSVSFASRWAHGSVGDLVTRYLSVVSRLGPTLVTQAKVRAVIEDFREAHGKRFVADFRFEHIDVIVQAKREKTTKDKKVVGGIHAARKLRKELVRLFDFAEKIGMRPAGSNPVRMSERVKVGPSEKTEGFHTWTEEEITQFRQHHKLGTSARLAMELMLWTGQRRSDAVRMGPDDVREGRVALTQMKTGKGLRLGLAPQLQEAIEATTPVPGAKAFLLTSHGKPFSPKGFGNWFRKRCDEAGLPQCSAHGLRKAMLRRMAERGMANRTLKAVSGHAKDDMVSLYTEGADQVRLADDAIAMLARWESNRDV